MKWEGKKVLAWDEVRDCVPFLITTSMQFHCQNYFIPSRNQDHSRFWAEAWECAFGNSEKQLISGNCCRICYHIYYQLTNFIKFTLLIQATRSECNDVVVAFCINHKQPPFYNMNTLHVPFLIHQLQHGSYIHIGFGVL